MRGYTTFAAMVIGSKYIMMKVYEISRTSGVRELDRISHEYELGKEAYITRHISFARIEEICTVLQDFQNLMKEYGVKDYECTATSVVRNAENRAAALNHIKIRTGITVHIDSNSELRFRMYKGLQMADVDVNRILEKNTAILDVGSGSVQISLFDKNNLYMTQNLDIGTSRITEILTMVQNNTMDYLSIMEEYIQYEVSLFRRSYLKDKKIKNVITMGDDLGTIKKIVPELHIDNTLDYDQVKYIFRKIRKAGYQDLALEYGMTDENMKAAIPPVLIYKMFLEQTKAETIYLARTNLCDGLAVDYADRTGQIELSHDFYQDIIASVKYIGKRYAYNKTHAQFIRNIAVEVFDQTKKFHGLGARERLVLEISAILHDIGKYINLSEPGKNGYNLVMSTEIMGLSHQEREEVANVIRYTTEPLNQSGESEHVFWRDEYLKIAQLSAVLRLANALDRGHKQKYDKVSIARKGKELIISVQTEQDMNLELSVFRDKAVYFSEILGVMPVLRQNRPM